MKSTVFLSICIALIVCASCKSKKTIEKSETYPTDVANMYDLIYMAYDARDVKDYEKASFYYEKFIEQANDSSDLSVAYQSYSFMLSCLAKQTKDKKYWKDIFQKMEKSVEYDSSYPSYLNWAIMLSIAARENNDNKKLFAQCFQKLKKAAELYPNKENTQQEWANNLLYLGVLKKNKVLINQSIEKYDKIINRNASFYNNYGLALLYLADIEKNIPQKKQDIEVLLLKADALDSNEAPEGLACLYAKIGDTDEALKWLEKYLENDGKLTSGKINSDFKNIRKDKRFKELIKKYKR